MTKPSLRAIFKLLTYCFAVPGVVFVALLVATLFNGGFKLSEESSPEIPMGLFGGFAPKSDAERLAELRSEAAKGIRSAKHALACALYRKAGTPEDRADAFSLLNELTANDASDFVAGEAAASLGQIYAEGLGVPRDAAKAAHYRIIADKAGVSSVCVPLALAHLKGDGVAKDETAAARMLERSAGEYSSGGIFWEAAAGSPR